MKDLLIISLSLFLILNGCTNTEKAAPAKDISRLTESDRKEIINTFMLTQDAWNEGNLEEFMKGYWVSDSLVFVGSRGATYGYEPTLESYRRGYPDLDAMGKLKFDIVDLRLIDTQTAIMIGKFYLTRTIGDLQGYYTLIWQKINGEWVIISDHSSGEPVTEE